jgi:hypothetical protein
MGDKPKKPGWAFWATVVVVGFLVYALSIGPAVWLLAHVVPPAAVGFVLLFYAPIVILAESTGPTKDLLQWYVHLWAENVSISLF